MNSTANMKEGTDGQMCGRFKWTGTVVFENLLKTRRFISLSAVYM